MVMHSEDTPGSDAGDNVQWHAMAGNVTVAFRDNVFTDEDSGLPIDHPSLVTYTSGGNRYEGRFGEIGALPGNNWSPEFLGPARPRPVPPPPADLTTMTLDQRINQVLDEQRDPQLDVILTNLFSGYEHEPPEPSRLQSRWEYTVTDREGFLGNLHESDTERGATHAAYDSVGNVTRAADRGRPCGCGPLDPINYRLNLPLNSHDTTTETAAYRDGLKGQNRSLWAASHDHIETMIKHHWAGESPLDIWDMGAYHATLIDWQE